MKLRYYENSYQDMSKGNLIRSLAVLDEDKEFRINHSSIIQMYYSFTNRDFSKNKISHILLIVIPPPIISMKY